MSITISSFHRENKFHSSRYAWLERNRNASNFKEAFEPIECLGFKELITARNIFLNPSDNLISIFDKGWLKKHCFSNNDAEAYRNSFIENGFSEEEANSIIKESYKNAFRAATWSKHNESLGKEATQYAVLSLVTGAVRQLLLDKDSEIASSSHNDVICKSFNVINSLFRSQRNYYQYTMYSLPDDDSAMNVYQADVYGNKIAGTLAEASTFMETKINPLLLPVSEFFPKHIGESIRKLASLPASLWWRARMPAYINQEFFTDFLRYILHKPLSVVFRDSEKEILEIEKRGNLKWDYIKKRLLKNIGHDFCKGEPHARSEHVPLGGKGSEGYVVHNKNSEVMSSLKHQELENDNDKEASLTRKLLETSTQLFNKDPTKQMEAGRRLGEFIAPSLGMYGFFTSALGNTASALFKLFNVENTFSKISNLIQATSIYSQQMIYLPKIMIPFLAETRMIGKLLKSKEIIESEDYESKKEEMEKLLQKRKIVSGIGLGSFFLHTVNLVGKTMGDKKEGIGKISGLIDEIACNMTNLFFSNRRHVMGYQFRIENPEFMD